jgi:energy-coupling factor transporter ATP-binding protein EcfA2
VNRAVRILLILGIGSLVLWEVVAQGTRVWAKYKLIKEPLPSLTTLLPTSMIQPLIALTFMSALVFITVSTVLRARKLFGLIPLSELTRHVVVLGPTGSGKTTVAKSIIEKALRSAKDIKVIIIDWKGEYLFPGATIIRKLTVWDVPGDSPREKALLAVELIREAAKDVVEVTPASSLLLLKVLEKEYEEGVPTTEKIISTLEKHAVIASKEGRHAESNMFLALVRRLYILLIDEERKDENILGNQHLIIYDLGGLISVYLKTLYSNYILASIYREAMKSRGNELRTLLVAEEAQNYVHPRRPNEVPSLAERLIYELRAFGVGVVLVCPDPELLPQGILKDVGTIVAMSPDSLPRFALERYLFRASLEEAEDVLKRMKKAKAIIYYKNRLHFLRRLPKPPKLKPKGPKGDRMGVTDSGVGSLRAWPILPRRSPGRLAPKVIEAKEGVEKKPVIEVKVAEAGAKVEPKVIEAVEPKITKEPLKLEEEEYEEEPEIEVGKPETAATEPTEEKKVGESAVEVKEIEEELTEEMPLEEPEPAPKGPPIPSSLPYRGSLCPAGRPHLTPVH